MTPPVDWLQALLLIEPTAQAHTLGPEYSGLHRLDDLPLPSQAELEAAWAAWGPPVTWSPDQFLSRFTDSEQDAIEDSDAPIARKARRSLYTNQSVRSDSANLAALMAGLVQVGLITQQRADQILDPAWSPD